MTRTHRPKACNKGPIIPRPGVCYRGGADNNNCSRQCGGVDDDNNAVMCRDVVAANEKARSKATVISTTALTARRVSEHVHSKVSMQTRCPDDPDDPNVQRCSSMGTLAAGGKA